MSSKEIRRLNEKDLESYQDIRLEALKEAPDAFTASYEEEARQNEDFFLGRFRDSMIFGCFQDAELVGMVGVAFDRHRKCAHTANIWGVYTKPDHRRGGISLLLLKEAIRCMPPEIEQVRLSVGYHNKAARKLYKKLKFDVCGVEQRALKVDGKYYDEILMVRFLE